MSKCVESGDVEFDIVEVLDEIGSAERGLWYVLIAGGAVGGSVDAMGAFVMSRCLLEVETGYAFGAEGRFERVAHSGHGKSSAQARQVRAHVRRALRDGERAGAEFVICYHVEGDPGWYTEWSAAHSRQSALDAVRQYLTGGML